MRRIQPEKLTPHGETKDSGHQRLEQLVVDRMQQRHMFSTFDWKLVDCVMVNHLRDAVKRLAKLSKDVVAASATAAIITANDLHVHETPRTPGNEHISTCQPNEPLTLILNDNFLLRLTRGQSNLTKSASQGAHSPVRGHPRGSKVVPLNSWGRVSY